MSRPVLYIVAAFATATVRELERTACAIRRALELGWAPVFVPFIYRGLLRDEIPSEREVALLACESFIAKSDALLFVPRDDGAPPSSGMRRDLAAWERALFIPARPAFEWPELPAPTSSNGSGLGGSFHLEDPA